MYPSKYPPRPTNPNAAKVRINDQIRAPQIRLIGANGEQIGIVPTKEGIRRADEAELDLVEVAPLAKPPVCRILDIGKYLYSLEKKEKEARKKQKVILVKEVKMGCKIDEHDYQTKLRGARGFIEHGDKVKLTMMFRGREITHAEIGRKLIANFIEDLSDVAEVERNGGLEGNAIHVYFAPKPAAPKKPAEKKESSGAAPKAARPAAPKTEQTPEASKDKDKNKEG